MSSLRDKINSHAAKVYGTPTEDNPPQDPIPSVDTREPAYLAAFLAEHSPYRCPRCYEPVLLETTDKGKRYTNWYDGRPHWQTCNSSRWANN